MSGFRKLAGTAGALISLKFRRAATTASPRRYPPDVSRRLAFRSRRFVRPAPHWWPRAAIELFLHYHLREYVQRSPPFRERSRATLLPS
jgi:hypothetical protein